MSVLRSKKLIAAPLERVGRSDKQPRTSAQVSVSSVIRDQGFCDLCTKICEAYMKPSNTGRASLRFDQTLDQLRSNVSRGCRFCQFRYGLFSLKDLQELELHGCNYQECELSQADELGYDLDFWYHLAREHDEQRQLVLCSAYVSLKSCP